MNHKKLPNQKKRAHSYSKFIKALILITCWLLIKTLISCNPPPPDYFLYNTLKIDCMNNAEDHIKVNLSDTIYAEAVCLKLSLSDSTLYYAQSGIKSNTSSLTYKTATAMSIDESYIPEKKIQSIKVVSLDNQINAGDDVTDLFLYTDKTFTSQLYQYQNWAISEFNEIQSTPGCHVYMVLKTPVQNNKAQFYIEVQLEDGAILSDTTNTFHIIQS